MKPVSRLTRRVAAAVAAVTLLPLVAGCSRVSEGSVVAYTAATGEACSPARGNSRDYAVVESFINQGTQTAVLHSATIDDPSHVHIAAGPWSYPGQNAGIRVVPYPLPADPAFKAVRAAWQHRTSLSGKRLRAGQVVYVALVLRRDADASAGTIHAVRLSYTVGADQHANAGDFSYRMQTGDCS